MTGRKAWRLWICLLTILVASRAEALPPPRPGLVDPHTLRYRTTGHKVPVLPKAVREHRISPQKGKYPLAAGFFAATRSLVAGTTSGVRPRAIPTPASGALRPLIVLVDFADKPHDDAAHPASAYTPLFFGSGASDLSVANYWNEVSYGTFTLTTLYNPDSTSVDIVGWIRPAASPALSGEFRSTIVSYAQITDSVTGVNLTNLRTLVTDIVAYLDGAPNNLDFAPYADPATGIVQSLILVHAGAGQEDTGNTADLFSHSASLASPAGTNDTDAGGHQVTVADYSAVPEQLSFDPATGASTPVLIGAGVIAHEMGHLFGLPDLYPTSGTSGQTGGYSGVGVFDLMGYGLWGSNLLARPDNPAHLSAWSKSDLGWVTPTVLSATSSNTLLPAGSTASAYKVYPNGPGDESQYFLLELRGKDGPGLFDRYLPGNGVLVWRVDSEQMSGQRSGNAANNDSSFPALSVQEADLSGASPSPHLFQPFSIGADAFGAAGDFFSSSGQVFSRVLPVDGQNLTNSSPTINTSSVNHLFDAGFLVTVRNFVVTIVTRIVNAVFDLAVELPYWKVYRSTDAQPTLNTNKTLSYGFDGSNRTWVGTTDQGIWIFALTTWTQINSALLRSSRIQAMAYEPSTGSMWVGTDQTVAKIRLDQVRSDEIFPASPSTINVKGIRIARDLTKWIGGGRQLAIVTDAGNNQPSGLAYTDLTFKVPLLSGEQITCVELDNVFSTDQTKDLLYIGTSVGNIYRNFRESDNAVLSLYTLSLLSFEKMTALSLAANAPGAVNAMAIDKTGLLWVATDRGVFAFDRGDPSSSDPGIRSDRYNPFDLAGDNSVTSLVYFPPSFSGTGAHGSAGFIEPTGIAFQDTGQARNIVWVSYGDTVGSTESASGGAGRIDPNVLLNTRIPKDNAAGINAVDSARIGHATMTFTRNASSPEKGPAVNDLIAAAGDGSSNLWFGTKNSGAVRFGSGASLTLDKTVYINDSAAAGVTLVDENAVTTSLEVTVTGSSDGTGFSMTLPRGTDNVYRGTFGFSTSATDNTRSPKVILVKNGDTVTVSYRDINPPSTKSASATWRSVFPFHDSLFIGGCFLSTAAYGSAMAPEVQTLRRFRDAWLLRAPGGEALVSAYYRVSPPLAAFIAGRPLLRLAARVFLAPAVLLANVAVGACLAEKIASLLIVLLLPGFLFLFPRRTIGRAGRR
ncbi:MAG: M6 family metalloprotease domain-containing protein [Deltaproteobacteria bacterium]|nr:M6 family metalloprotease domain-containing protein [Deltaproteobacteria bacterium]